LVEHKSGSSSQNIIRKMKIVSIEEIPKITESTPLANVSELYAIGQKMEALCVENNGVGLAAAQVGIPWKFFVCYDEKSKCFNYMVDCEYKPLSEDKHLSIEGCLSIRGSNNQMRHFKVMRYDSISVTGKKIAANDKLEIEDFQKVIRKGLECAIFQHEIDHQNNILISDIGQEIHIQDKLK